MGAGDRDRGSLSGARGEVVMSSLRAWCLRFTGLLGKERKDREIAEELDSHLQFHIEDNLRSGMSPKQARRDALVKLGGVEQTKEKYRERRSLPFVESFLQDLRFGVRMLRKSPGFTAVAILTLGLGIGANTAIFSVVNAVLLRSSPYPNVDEIVQFTTTRDDRLATGEHVHLISDLKYNAWREQNDIFQDASGYLYNRLNLTGIDHPEQIQVVRATADYFRLFGIPILRGRAFTADEELPNGRHVAVLSDGLWRRAFGSDSRILGKTISLDGNLYEVIGIVAPGVQTEPPDPESARYATEPEAWIPLPIAPNSSNQIYYFFAAARLKPEVTPAVANARLRSVSEDFHRAYPTEVLGPRAGLGAEVMQESLVGDVRPSLLVLAGAVGLVLLIACANVAGLSLVRAVGRRREIHIRAATGASRIRLLRQLLTESLMTSVAGGALGLLLGIIGVRVLLAANPGDIPRIGAHGPTISLDWRVLCFTAFVSVATAILSGLTPALLVSRTDPSTTIKESAGALSVGFRQNRTGVLLVLGEVGLTLVLLVGAILLIRTFLALRSVNPGFDKHNLLTLQMSLSGSGFNKTAGVAQFIQAASLRIDSLPGVIDAETALSVPLIGGGTNVFTVVGRPPDPTISPLYHGHSRWTSVSPGYFGVMRIPLLRGRVFTPADDGEAAMVVIINQAMARQYWASGDPLKDQIIIGRGIGPGFEEPQRQIVGIVGDVYDTALNQAPPPEMYIPAAQVIDARTARGAVITWIVRSRVEPHSLSTKIEQQLEDASGGIPVGDVRSMDEIVALSTSRQQFNMSLMSIFGFSALLLATIGMYGLIAYAVQRRTHEIGIRVALGAQRSDVLKMVVGGGLKLTLIGVCIGIAGALALTRFLSSLLFGVRSTDPATFISVVLLLLGVTLLACFIPARRATRVDPVVALRHE
jgi:putative ABC transport system permease protein